MDWFSIDMPPGSLENGVYHRLCRAFQHAFISAGAPTDLALFAVRHREACRRLYLTPSSVRYVPELIRHHDGHRCAVPEASAVTLVYGVPGATALLSRRDTRPIQEERSTKTSIYQLTGGHRAVSTG